MEIGFNEGLNFPQIKRSFRTDARLRIRDFLRPENAQQLNHALSSEVVYQLALFSQGKNLNVTEDQIRRLPTQEQQSIQQDVLANAGKGIGFLYGRHALKLGEESNPILHSLHRWLNSETVLGWVRDLSGHRDVVSASAQATRYVAGQFLTRHKDTHATEQRRLAYVISFTPDWHPDWGGLLQFYENDGTPRDAWAPGFNVLSLFDVKHVHAVSYVAPYAKAARYSITGWFLATETE